MGASRPDAAIMAFVLEMASGKREMGTHTSVMSATQEGRRLLAAQSAVLRADHSRVLAASSADH